MLKTSIVLLVVACYVYNTEASMISRGDGVTVTGRLNSDGLSSTVIKTQHGMNHQQQQHVPVFRQQPPNDPKNDDAHFRMFYKSNSGGRSVKHEMEHRFYKNPSFLFNQQPAQQQQQPQQQYGSDGFHPYMNVLNQRQQQAQPQMSRGYSSFLGNLNNLNGNAQTNQGPNNDRSTMFNLHYHDTYDTPSNNNNNYNQFRMQNQQNQQNQQYEQNRKKSLLKMMLANFVSSQAHSQYQQSQPQQQQSNQNGVQYKIVNLKFKIEPTHGKFVGQGFVGTNNGAGNVLNSQNFNLWPSELPALVRNILSHAHQDSQHHFGAAHGFLKKKREDVNASEEAEVEKRDSSVEQNGEEETTGDDSQRKRRSSEEEELSDESERERRGEEDDSVENDEKVNDNEFQESFKSLQRRDDNEGSFEEMGGEDAERQERNYEEEDSSAPSEGNGEEQSVGNEEEQNY